MFDKSYIGDAVLGQFSSPQQMQSWSRVTIQVDDNTSYTAGTDTGRELTLSNPWGTQQMAEDILARIRGSGYQPYSAEQALLDPAAELGDAVEVRGIYGGLYSRTRKLEKLYSATVAAPSDEEINHEYPYKSAQTRSVERKFKQTTASLNILSDRIQAEVEEREKDSTAIRARLEIQAGQIAARVEKTGGSASSFGWKLDEKSWELQSNGSTVLRADASGLDIKGRITALSGKIGGFDIQSDYLSYNGQTWGGTNTWGAYIGSSGIQLGRNFKVDMSGNLTAASGRFEGTVYAGNISYGGDAGYFYGGGISSGSISGGWGGQISGGSIGTYNTTGGINTSLSYADFANGVFNGWNTASTIGASRMYLANHALGLSTISYKDSNGYSRTAQVVVWRD